MRLLRLVINDLRKDALWILLFGVVTSLIFLNLFIFARSYRMIKAQNAVIHRLEEKNTYFADVYENPYMGKGVEFQGSIDPDILRKYMEENFNHDGIGGCSLSVGPDNRTRVVSIQYLIGRKTELTSYEYDPLSGIHCMAKRGIRDLQGGKIALEGKEYPIELLPEEFKEFSRFGLEDKGDMIYVFCPDFQDYLSVAPKWETDEILLDSCVLVDPKGEDIRRFQKVVLEGAGAYGTLESTEHYLSTTDIEGERTHAMYVVFYSVAGIALITAMTVNLVRLMKRKFPDYAVHHLYGENCGHIYARMNLYSLGYQSLALFIFLFLAGGNGLLLPWMGIGAVGLVIMISLSVSLFLYREFRENAVLYTRKRAE